MIQYGALTGHFHVSKVYEVYFTGALSQEGNSRQIGYALDAWTNSS